MADPITSVSGLASGVQWRDLVDQIMAAEKARTLDPITARITLQDKQRTAWTTFQGLVSKLGDASKALQTGAAFGTVKATAGSSPTTNRALFAATATAGTSPGSYKVEVLDLARAEKLSGAVEPSATAALGRAGTFSVNGRAVSIDAADSLNAVRDKINAANAGASPSGVTATVLSTGAAAHRLVLTSAAPGSGGIDLAELSGTPLAALGVLDGTRAANLTASGGTQTQRFSSSVESFAQLVGASFPLPSTIKVGGQQVTIEASDTLSSILTKLQTAGVGAELAEESVNGATRYRLVVSGGVEADAGSANGLAESQRVLDVLGFTVGGRGAIAQRLEAGNPLTAGGAPATGATLLSAAGLQPGETLALRGTRGDGTAVSVAWTPAPGATVDDLLARLNAGDAFKGGARTATASLDASGRVVLADDAAGDSQLSLSITGGSINFGRTSTAVTGRLREVVDGSDARLRVDGVTLTRSGNSISDALAGVTLNLQQAEPGTVTDLTVDRDDGAAVDAVKAFATAYNDVVKFLDQQRATGQPLYANSVLRGTVSNFTAALRAPVAAAGEYSRAALAGLALTRDGTLAVDDASLRKALGTGLADIKTLFGEGGLGKAVSDAAANVTRSVTGTTATQITSLDGSQAASRKRAEAVQRRLDDRRQAMIIQYTQMEQALSRLQSQGTYLSGQLNALNKS
jgi:flagellar hook-associated protein 2